VPALKALDRYTNPAGTNRHLLRPQAVLNCQILSPFDVTISGTDAP